MSLESTLKTIAGLLGAINDALARIAKCKEAEQSNKERAWLKKKNGVEYEN